MGQTFYLESNNKWSTTSVCSGTSSLQRAYQWTSNNDRELSLWICTWHHNVSHYSQRSTINIAEDRVATGTQTSWRNEPTGVLWNSARVSVKFCSWVRKNPWQQNDSKPACWINPVCCDRQQTEHNSRVAWEERRPTESWVMLIRMWSVDSKGKIFFFVLALLWP